MKTNRKNKTVMENYAGNKAYSMDVKSELLQRVSTWLVNEPNFYGDTQDENSAIQYLIKSVAKKDPEFILKLACYCRSYLNLRTAPVILLVEASLIDECKPFVRKYTPTVIQRADQLTEVIAYLKLRIGNIGDLKDSGSMPNSLKRGLADSFENFDEYQFAKYNRDDAVKMRDVVNLVHPKPSDKSRSRLYKSILENTLAVPETWETIITERGSSKESWEYASTKMGYMALLRNLSNFIKYDCNLDKILAKITDPKRIADSRQLPFRFYSALKAVSDKESFDSNRVVSALADALDVSVSNISRLRGNTVIASDHSGSMDVPISEKSTMTRMETSDMMAGLAYKVSDNCLIYAFSEDVKKISVFPNSSVLNIMGKMKGSIPVGGTNTHLVFANLVENNIKANRVIIVTDEQFTGDSVVNYLAQYRNSNPECYFYIINVNGYGNTMVSMTEKNVLHINGWSEKSLQLISEFERGYATQLKEVEKYAQD